MPPLAVIIAAIQAVDATAPAFVKLIEFLKDAMSAKDQAAIDEALAAATAMADAQHVEAQNL